MTTIPKREKLRKSRYVSLSCQRCRAFKKKCDRKTPCTRCLKTGTSCQYYNLAESYQHSAEMASEFGIASVKVDRLLSSAIEKFEAHMDPEIILKWIGNSYSGIRLGIHSPYSDKGLEAKDGRCMPDLAGLLTSLRAYLQYYHASSPFLDMELLCESIKRAYSDSMVTDHDAYCIYMVFAIGGLITYGKSEDSGHENYSLVKKYYDLAHCIRFDSSSLSEVLILDRILLDLSYAIFFPRYSSEEVWNLAGMAARSIIALRYNQEPPSSLSLHEIDMQKRRFWSAYVGERNISILLGRPFLLFDEDIFVSLPSCIGEYGPMCRSLLGDISPATIETTKYVVKYCQNQGYIYSNTSLTRCMQSVDPVGLLQSMKQKADDSYDNTGSSYQLSDTSQNEASRPLGHFVTLSNLCYYGLIELIFQPSPVFPTVLEQHLPLLVYSVQQRILLTSNITMSRMISWNWNFLLGTLKDAIILMHCEFSSGFDTRLDEHLAHVVNILKSYPREWSLAHKAGDSISSIKNSLQYDDLSITKQHLNAILNAIYGDGSIYYECFGDIQGV